MEPLRADSAARVIATTVPVPATRRVYVDATHLVNAKDDVKAVVEVMDVATSSIQDLPYLDTLSRGLDNFSRLSCDYCKPRWKAIGTVARKMQALVDVVRGMVVNITDQGQKPLPASLAEVFRGVEGCIMQALVVFCACQVQSKRRRDIALSYIKAGDLGKNVRECEKEFRAMYKLLKERLGVADAWSNLSNLTEGRKNQLANMALHSEPTVTDVSITTAADILDHDSGPSDTARDAATSILSDLDTLWLGALDEYKRRQSPDDVQSFYKFTSALPEKGVTTELVLNLLDNAQADARMRRRGKERLPRPIKDVLTAVLDGLSVILDTGAETASSFGVPGGKGIFAAVAVLLQAANRASATLDELEKLLRYSAMYIEHLRIRIQGRALGSEARSLAIKGLVAILKTMDMATKSLREGTFKSFLKAMFTKAKDHVSTARQDLQDIIDEEGRLIMIEGFRDVWIQLSDAVYEVRQIRAAQEMQVRESLPRGQGPLPQNGLVISNDVMAKVDQHSVMLAELLRRHPSGPSTPVWPDLIHNMLGHFSPEDRDRILAMFGALLSAAAACVSMSSGGTDGALGAQLAITQEPGLVLMAFIPMAFSFLFLYTGWKLRSVARSIGAPPGVITILDVFGTPLPPISEEIFSSPSKTYDYARQMMLKQGLRIPYWRLGTSKTIALDPNAEKWDEDIKPGTVLNMSVVVYSYASACPYCQTVSTTRERNGDLIFCPNPKCGRLYGEFTSEGASITEAKVRPLRAPDISSIPSSTTPPSPQSWVHTMARSKHRADGEGPKHSMNLFPRVILGNISARKEHDLATITSLLEHLPDDSESYKSKRVLFYVEANHEYSATISAEFDFRVGDIIAVTATSEDGWWSGYILNEKVKVERHGVFPANFVQMLDTAKPEEPGFDAVAIASLFERVMAKSKADSAARAESHKDRITILFYVKAKYDYSATISEELDFKAGDMVAVTATFQNGWWSGNLLDEAGSIVRHGSFPSNLMEVPGTVQASYDYSATIPEEFDFKEGDIIAVTATPEDGWWSGDLLGEAGTVVRHGIFPRNYVYPLLRSSSSEE